MALKEPFKGNPAEKQYQFLTDFSGGMNTKIEDSLLRDNVARNITNFDIIAGGLLSKRRGFVPLFKDKLRAYLENYFAEESQTDVISDSNYLASLFESKKIVNSWTFFIEEKNVIVLQTNKGVINLIFDKFNDVLITDYSFNNKNIIVNNYAEKPVMIYLYEESGITYSKLLSWNKNNWVSYGDDSGKTTYSYHSFNRELRSGSALYAASKGYSCWDNEYNENEFEIMNNDGFDLVERRYESNDVKKQALFDVISLVPGSKTISKEYVYNQTSRKHELWLIWYSENDITFKTDSNTLPIYKDKPLKSSVGNSAIKKLKVEDAMLQYGSVIDEIIVNKGTFTKLTNYKFENNNLLTSNGIPSDMSKTIEYNFGGVSYNEKKITTYEVEKYSEGYEFVINNANYAYDDNKLKNNGLYSYEKNKVFRFNDDGSKTELLHLPNYHVAGLIDDEAEITGMTFIHDMLVTDNTPGILVLSFKYGSMKAVVASYNLKTQKLTTLKEFTPPIFGTSVNENWRVKGNVNSEYITFVKAERMQSQGQLICVRYEFDSDSLRDYVKVITGDNPEYIFHTNEKTQQGVYGTYILTYKDEVVEGVKKSFNVVHRWDDANDVEIVMKKETTLGNNAFSAGIHFTQNANNDVLFADENGVWNITKNKVEYSASQIYPSTKAQVEYILCEVYVDRYNMLYAIYQKYDYTSIANREWVFEVYRYDGKTNKMVYKTANYGSHSNGVITGKYQEFFNKDGDFEFYTLNRKEAKKIVLQKVIQQSNPHHFPMLNNDFIVARNANEFKINSGIKFDNSKLDTDSFLLLLKFSNKDDNGNVNTIRVDKNYLTGALGSPMRLTENEIDSKVKELFSHDVYLYLTQEVRNDNPEVNGFTVANLNKWEVGYYNSSKTFVKIMWGEIDERLLNYDKTVWPTSLTSLPKDENGITLGDNSFFTTNVESYSVKFDYYDVVNAATGTTSPDAIKKYIPDPYAFSRVSYNLLSLDSETDTSTFDKDSDLTKLVNINSAASNIELDSIILINGYYPEVNKKSIYKASLSGLKNYDTDIEDWCFAWTFMSLEEWARINKSVVGDKTELSEIIKPAFMDKNRQSADSSYKSGWGKPNTTFEIFPQTSNPSMLVCYAVKNTSGKVSKGSNGEINWGSPQVDDFYMASINVVPNKTYGVSFTPKETMRDFSKVDKSMVWKNQLFLYGGSNSFFVSDVNNFGYFPMAYNTQIPSDSPIQSMTVYYDSLIVATERQQFVITGNSPADFVINELNDDIGVVAAKSVKNNANYIFQLTADGVYLVKSLFNFRDRYNTEKVDIAISGEITSDKDANAVVWNNKYYINIPSKREIWVYYNDFKAWIRYESPLFNLNNMFIINDELILVSNYTGQIYKFSDVAEDYHGEGPYEDISFLDMVIRDDTGIFTKRRYPIESTYKSKEIDFGLPNHDKKLKKLHVRFAETPGKNNLDVKVYIDGTLKVSPDKMVVVSDNNTGLIKVEHVHNPSISTTAETHYDYEDVMYTGNRNNIGNKHNEDTDQLHEVIVAGRGRNMQFEVKHKQNKRLNIKNFATLLKVKKPKAIRTHSQRG